MCVCVLLPSPQRLKSVGSIIGNSSQLFHAGRSSLISLTAAAWKLKDELEILHLAHGAQTKERHRPDKQTAAGRPAQRACVRSLTDSREKHSSDTPAHSMEQDGGCKPLTATVRHNKTSPHGIPTTGPCSNHGRWRMSSP